MPSKSGKSPAMACHDEKDSDDAEEPQTTLGSIEKSKTITFPVHANYTNWNSREAFRELLQNWRDAIIRFCEVSEKDFRVVREEKVKGLEFDIVYKAIRQNTSDDSKKLEDCVGYVRFSGHNDEGIVDICNRSATLQPEHLELGVTSKTNDPGQAGAHGEGLKIALLVMMRSPQNHDIRCRSGGFNWSFNFNNNGRLVARLNRMTSKAIESVKTENNKAIASGSLLPFASDPEKDVQFRIGYVCTGRDERGIVIKRIPVNREDFDRWIRSALFMQEIKDDAIISTKHGDLLLQPQLRGSIYLKGLLLAESRRGLQASITNKALQFGYNFADGKTNRERQSVASAYDESQAIFALWGEVLTIKADMVGDLSNILNDKRVEYADVAGVQNMDRILAERLHDYLVGEKFPDKWYYCLKDMIRHSGTRRIIRGLGYDPVELSEPYWTLMSEKGFFHTALDEEHRRFMKSPASPVPDTNFAASMHRLLLACFHACPQTKGIPISFVQAGQLGLTRFLVWDPEKQEVKVHDQCLRYNEVVKVLKLPRDCMMMDVIFHAVDRLFLTALTRIPMKLVDQNMEYGARTKQRLLEYFRLSNFAIYTSATKAVVTWPVDARLSQNSDVEIQCHHASCLSRIPDGVLIAEDASRAKMPCLSGQRDSTQSAACQVKQIGYADGTCTFQMTAGTEKYFVLLLTPSDPDSIVVISEPQSAQGVAIRPLDSPTPAVSQACSFTLGSQIKPFNPYDYDKNRWYEAKGTEGAQAVIGFKEGDERLIEKSRKRQRT